ncbi:DUF58 domain-containing protein [Desulfobacterales bacterium HSG16]|nr:DUF58 domain-containing protein [Desulfobacterales bacterium HSG16]
MLSPEIIKKIKKIHIKSGRLVNSMMAGQYKSVFRGSGIEFEEVREYTPGDEVKSIDWKVSARLGHPYVKRFREERELIVMLLLDMSASGSFGTVENLKRETAAEIASVLAFNAIRNNDKVGAILFTDRVEKYIPPKKGASHVWRVIKEMFDFEPENTGTDIRNAVGYLGRVCAKKSVVFLISDFLAGREEDRLVPGKKNDLIKGLRTGSRKHELIAVMLSDPGEFILPEAGILCCRDVETGRTLFMDASDEKTRKRFEGARVREYRDSVEALKSADIDRIEVQTTDSVVDALTKYFRYREQRKR